METEVRFDLYIQHEENNDNSAECAEFVKMQKNLCKKLHIELPPFNDTESVMDCPDNETAKKAHAFFVEIQKSELGQKIKLDVGDIGVYIENITSNFPILKYISYGYFISIEQTMKGSMGIARVKKLMKIVNNYRDLPAKQAIWQCQKELIASGFEGNARY
jgi:hypothetical protein